MSFWVSRPSLPWTLIPILTHVPITSFVESDKTLDMRHPALKVPNLRGLVEGDVDFDELKSFLSPDQSIVNIEKGSIVELTSGPFKDEKAKVVRIDEAKEDVVLELIEAAVPIPVTVKGDQIRLIQKEAE